MKIIYYIMGLFVSTAEVAGLYAGLAIAGFATTVSGVLCGAVSQSATDFIIAGVGLSVGLLALIPYCLFVRMLRNNPFIRNYRSTSERYSR